MSDWDNSHWTGQWYYLDQWRDWLGTNTLEQLWCNRVEVPTSQLAHKTLISPVWCTLPELWAKNFVLCLPTNEFVRVNALEARSTAPYPSLQSLEEYHFVYTDIVEFNWSGKAGSTDIIFTDVPLIMAWLSQSDDLPLSKKIAYSFKMWSIALTTSLMFSSLSHWDSTIWT